MYIYNQLLAPQNQKRILILSLANMLAYPRDNNKTTRNFPKLFQAMLCLPKANLRDLFVKHMVTDQSLNSIKAL